MKVINIQAAKTHLSRIVEQAAAGEEIVLAKAGKPLVRIVPCTAARKPRIGGQLKGKIKESADCWAPDLAVDALITSSPLYPAHDSGSDEELVAEDPK
jgi:prevent-host-death family protein